MNYSTKIERRVCPLILTQVPPLVKVNSAQTSLLTQSSFRTFCCLCGESGGRAKTERDRGRKRDHGFCESVWQSEFVCSGRVAPCLTAFLPPLCSDVQVSYRHFTLQGKPQHKTLGMHVLTQSLSQFYPRLFFPCFPVFFPPRKILFLHFVP